MENIYSRNGMQTVINASGRMTKLGVSTISPVVGEVLLEAASNYVVMDDLLRFAGKKIGNMIGVEDACITSSASAGMALVTASLICGNNIQKVQHLFDILPITTKREVILLKGHNVDFGAPIAEMIQLGGGKVIEVGFANTSDLSDIRNAVSENTLAIFFIKSHHCVQKDMVNIKEVIEFADSINIPCVVDAAAEEDLSVYAKMGADFVCYSGAKAVEGPTSGFVVCKTHESADNMRLQYKGIGRAMKIGKECIMGLVAAVEEYLAGKHVPVVSKQDIEAFVAEINKIKGCSSSIIKDEAGRTIYRAKISFDEQLYGMHAKEVAAQLQMGSTAIYTRDYQANTGSIAIDPRPLNNIEELNTIYERIEQISKEGKNHGAN